MKIHELANRTGLPAATIRFYEKIGLLDARHVQRGSNNYREYSEEAVEQIQLIKEVQSAGFTLAEFKELDLICRTDELVAPKAAKYLQQKIDAIGAQIAELDRVRAYLISQLAAVQREGQILARE
jgi:MerR family transcriptional regulator, copper efflux regulator